MMVIFFGYFFQLRYVHYAREIFKMEHRIVLTVLTEPRDVFAKIHIFYVICNKASIAALYAFAEFGQHGGSVVIFCFRHFLFHHAAFRSFDKIDEYVHFGAILYLFFNAFDRLRCVEF